MSYTGIAAVIHSARITVFEARYSVPPSLPGYPIEHVRISVLTDGTIAAVPLGDPERTWRHRFPRWTISQIIQYDGPVPWVSMVGGLCLWYPMDSIEWRWHWGRGFDTYIQLVQRHLWAEEYFRLHGSWPTEEVPHGETLDGRLHPLPAQARCA